MAHIIIACINKNVMHMTVMLLLAMYTLFISIIKCVVIEHCISIMATPGKGSKSGSGPGGPAMHTALKVVRCLQD